MLGNLTKDKMFIVVEKMAAVEVKDKDGNVVFNPSDKKPMIDHWKTSTEMIRIDEIKSSRPWFPSKQQSKDVKGEMTILYLYGKKEGFPVKMIISESHSMFAERVDAKQLSINN